MKKLNYLIYIQLISNSNQPVKNHEALLMVIHQEILNAYGVMTGDLLEW